MNRLTFRRLVVNILWSLLYGLVIGYICFYNAFNEKQIVNSLENKVVQTIIIKENYTKSMYCVIISTQTHQTGCVASQNVLKCVLKNLWI